MHEYSLVQDVVRRVEEEARCRAALAVHRVRVAIGQLAGVEPELFRNAYELLRAGTMCDRAELELVIRPATFSCPGCGRRFAAGEPLSCGPCGRPARMDQGGDALILEAIDLEVP